MSAYPPPQFPVDTPVVLTQPHGNRYVVGDRGEVQASWRTAPGNPHFYTYHILFEDNRGDMSIPETKLKRAD
ncbi:hypothetical protein CPB85DRAFT_1439379 [Mucidula mucida]|nr:hypothetical protein CPB85DRAFT_1440923 [Mucidula mucida]KAF8900812.1 hypothetical protein CPB85DRAFT_1439379 [Mucidula mucida]